MSESRANFLVWFGYDESGAIASVVRIESFPDSFDLDKHFVDFMSGIYAGGGVEEIKREHIETPNHLLGVEGIAYVLYYQGKRFRAALPHFITLTEN